MRTIFVLACVAAGCLGEATFTNPDLSAQVLPDLSEPPADLSGFDATGLDLGGINCVMLNDCEKSCASDPKPQMCIANCKAMASSAAIMKEAALQMCFGQFCPQSVDGGTAICAAGDMGFSANCTKCISNSQIAPANACTAVATPDECHQCYNQAVACVNDK